METIKNVALKAILLAANDEKKDNLDEWNKILNTIEKVYENTPFENNCLRIRFWGLGQSIGFGPAKILDEGERYLLDSDLMKVVRAAADVLEALGE